MSYKYKTKPFDHQHKEFTEHGYDPARGNWWEQGCGKSKPIIDTVAHLYEEKHANGLCVIAPNGVHRNWVSDEMEAHCPDRVMERVRYHVWYSTDTKKHARSFEGTLKHDGLAMLVMSYNAVWTNRGRDAWRAFLKERECVYVLDESHRVKNPGSKWSKRILGSKTVAPFKRCLTGTPVANKPFDIYNPLRFLDPDVWKKYGIEDFQGFKVFFGVWETLYTREKKAYPNCMCYKNLDILTHEINRLGTRLLKDDVLDLPPKVYSKRYVEITPKQRALYNQLKEELAVESAQGELTALLAIVRLLRFQQIVCGYLPASDDDPELVAIPGGNPRLDLLHETCEDLPHQCIIWARFQEDHRLISQHPFFRNKCVMVNGTVTGPPRDAAVDRFKAGEKQFLVTSPAALGTGYTFNMAKTVIYYSNSFSLTDRLQSEDRPHRIGQEDKVHYIDFVSPNTVDVQIVSSMRKKRRISQIVTGDNILEWI